MSILNPTKNDFRTDEEFEQYKQRMKELEETEMTHNIQMIKYFRNKGESP